MMLLTAFVLLIGFVALAGMVARVSQLADETGQESRRGAVLEATVVLDGAQDAMERLATLVPPGADADTQDYMTALDAAFAHMDALQSARGFLVQFDPIACSDDGVGLPTEVAAPGADDAVFWTRLTVVRSDMTLTATVSHEVTDDDVGSPVVCP